MRNKSSETNKKQGPELADNHFILMWRHFGTGLRRVHKASEGQRDRLEQGDWGRVEGFVHLSGGSQLEDVHFATTRSSGDYS